MNALGSAWFVDEVRWVKDADEEIAALGSIDPASTVLIDERYKAAMGDAKAIADPAANVTLDQYRTNELTYSVNSGSGSVVVFSEIWYGPDWQATIDGKPVEHVRADYVLRAMAVPPGEHTIVFKVKGDAYRTSQGIALASSALLLLLVLGMVVIRSAQRIA
ncbi:MAG: YfhO family protein [Flavobacteriales bacterium]